MRKFKGIKSTWRKVENVVRADYIGASHKICDVNTEMSYPATKEQGEANMKLILAAPKMLEALENLENDANQIPDHAWRLVQDAIKCALD
jgi:hypothetical protein